VLSFLRREDPDAAQRVAQAYACFDHFSGDSSAYGQAAAYGLAPSCERDAVNALLAMRERMAAAVGPKVAAAVGAGAGAGGGGRAALAAGGGGGSATASGEEAFYAAVNAQVVVDAERYYREMFR
jgi:erythromycin esterase-like protein